MSSFTEDVRAVAAGVQDTFRDHDTTDESSLIVDEFDRCSFISEEDVSKDKEAFRKLIGIKTSASGEEVEDKADDEGCRNSMAVEDIRRRYYSLDQGLIARSQKMEASAENDLELVPIADAEATPELNNFRRIQDKIRHKYCSTSSVFAQNTMTTPNVYQLVFCVAAALQARISESLGDALKDKNAGTIFDIKPDISSILPEGTHDPTLLAEETRNDDVLRTHILSGAAPSIFELIEFLSYLCTSVGYSAECNIIALIYINRAFSTSSIVLTNSNWRSLWTTAIMLAQKVWDDVPMRSSGFSTVLNGSISRKLIKNWELEFLGLINFSTLITKELYGTYYFELRSFYNDIMANKPDASKFALRPLTRHDGKLLNTRSDIRIFEGSRKLAEKLKLDKGKKKKHSSREEANAAKISLSLAAETITSTTSSAPAASSAASSSATAASSSSSSTTRLSSTKTSSISSSSTSSKTAAKAATKSSSSRSSEISSLQGWGEERVAGADKMRSGSSPSPSSSSLSSISSVFTLTGKMKSTDLNDAKSPSQTSNNGTADKWNNLELDEDWDNI